MSTERSVDYIDIQNECSDGKYQDKISRDGQSVRCPLTLTETAVCHMSTGCVKSQHESAKFSLFFGEMRHETSGGETDTS